jgi:hypothetical protein
MIVTITNQLAVPLTVGYPFNVTLTENGGAADAAALGMTVHDLVEGDAKGDPAYKRIDRLRQIGSLTVAVAVDANDNNILDEANEL